MKRFNWISWTCIKAEKKAVVGEEMRGEQGQKGEK